MDYRCFSYITINGSQSYCSAHTYQSPAQETKLEIPPTDMVSFSLLQLMPPGESMYKGKGYDDMISCTACSLSQHLM